MPKTTTVRVYQHTREAIALLGERRGQSAAVLLDDLVARASEDELLEEMNRSYARLRSDNDAWTAELAERSAWDTTLADGLNNRD